MAGNRGSATIIDTKKHTFPAFFTWFCPRRARRHIVERLKWIRIQTLTEKWGFSFTFALRKEENLEKKLYLCTIYFLLSIFAFFIVVRLSIHWHSDTILSVCWAYEMSFLNFPLSLNDRVFRLSHEFSTHLLNFCRSHVLFLSSMRWNWSYETRWNVKYWEWKILSKSLLVEGNKQIEKTLCDSFIALKFEFVPEHSRARLQSLQDFPEFLRKSFNTVRFTGLFWEIIMIPSGDDHWSELFKTYRCNCKCIKSHLQLS